MSVFNLTKSALTLGIIGDSFGQNNAFVQFIRDSNIDPTWEVEIACNGFHFNSWANYSANQVTNELTSFSTMLFNTYRISARTVLPPQFLINQYTFDGVQAAGWTHVSASKTNDPQPYAITHSPYYRFPHNPSLEFLSTSTATAMMSTINTGVATDGFAVGQLFIGVV